MKKILASILIIGCLTNIFALSSEDISSAGFNDLTTQQQAEILKMVADKKQTAIEVVAAAPVVDQAQKWVDLGGSIGKGLASTARELGVAVNDFSQTSIGKWTMFLIVFKIMGSTIIHIFGGLIFLIFGITFTTIILNRQNPMTIKYDSTTGKKILQEREELKGDIAGPFWIAYILIIGVSIILMITG